MASKGLAYFQEILTVEISDFLTEEEVYCIRIFIREEKWSEAVIYFISDNLPLEVFFTPLFN